MAKITLQDIDSEAPGWSSIINSNNAGTEAALENTLSRDGSTPNQMEAPLDMNSQKILNVPKGSDPTDVATVANVNDGVTTTAVVLSTNTVAVWVYPLTSAETGAGVTTGLIDGVSGWRFRPGDPRRYSASLAAGIIIAESQGFVLIEPEASFSLSSSYTTTAPWIFKGGTLDVNGGATVLTFGFPVITLANIGLTTSGGGTVVYNVPSAVLGDGAAGTAQGVAIGRSALCNGAEGIAIGDAAAVPPTGVRATAIGDGASADDTDSIAIGTSAATDSASTNATAVGNGAGVSTAINGTAVGSQSSVTGLSGVAVGVSAAATNLGVSVGASASGTQPDAVAVGRATSATGTGAVAVGPQATSSSSGGVAIGNTAAQSGGSQGVAIGNGVTATNGAQAFGASEDAANTTRIGPGGDSFKFGNAVAALADGDLDASTVNIWVNEAGNALTIKVKYADGVTVKSGTVALT